MEELYSLIRVYLFFGVYEFVSVALAIAVFYKPKFLFNKNRWQTEEVAIPQWIKVFAVLNLVISSLFLGVFSYFLNLFNFKEFL